MRVQSAVALSALATAVSAFSVQQMNNFRNAFHAGVEGWEGRPHAPKIGNATFQQYIDHENPSLGTFPQFYYYSSEWYAGPGSPIILFTPGEVNATGYQSYATLNRTTGVLAKEIGAGVVVLEHRYWGTSSPTYNLTTKNMQYLTLKNSISDLTHFAQTVRLPFDSAKTSVASRAPWVLSGGSYSGALSAWTASTQPGTFWAYHASSAPVEAISDYWQYFAPVQQGMPANCSKDISLVVDHIDNILQTGSADDKLKLKTMFNLQTVKHDHDFAAALENGPWLWQGNQFYRNSGFFDFCDAVENASPGNIPNDKGVGLEKALSGYARWFNETLLPGFCAGYGYWTDEYETACFDTHDFNNPLFRDTSMSNTMDRQWNWMLCNEPFGYWQDGAPSTRPSLVSRLVDADYWTRQCASFFPEEDGHTYGIARGHDEAAVNAYTRGWNLSHTERLVWANGQFDPWRSSGVSSDFRDGGPLHSTPQAPVVIVPGGFHTSDLITQNGVVNPDVQKAIDAIVSQLKTWVAQYPRKGGYWGWDRKRF